MRRLYVILLRLYPRDFRAAFGHEMTAAFDQSAAERRLRGRGTFLRFAFKETAGLVFGAAAEWVAKLTTDRPLRGRTLPDVTLMRPAGVSWDDHYRNSFLPDELMQAQTQVDLLVNRIIYAIAHHDFEHARSYSHEEAKARETLRLLREKYSIGGAP